MITVVLIIILMMILTIVQTKLFAHSNIIFFSFVTAPEMIKGAPPSYICRLSGVAKENWTFWLEVKESPFI